MLFFQQGKLLLCDCHGNVVDGQPPLQEEIFSHVGEGGGGVNGVPAHAVPLQVRGRVSPAGNDDARDRDLDRGTLEQLVTKVDPVPEADHVALDGNVVLPVQSGRRIIIDKSSKIILHPLYLPRDIYSTNK